MKKQIILISSLLIAITLLISVIGCKKKTDSTTFKETSIMAGNIDLDAAYSANNVPVNPTIVATFPVNINPASVVNAITLVRSYDTANIELTVNVSGSTITIVPNTDLGSGSLFLFRFSSAITSTDGKVLDGFLRTFTTIGSFVPNGMVAYYSFENTTADVLNHYNPKAGGVIDVAYAASYSTAAGMAGKFNGTSTLIEIPKGDSLMLTNDFTLAFWVKADSTKHGQFVMGLAGWFGFQFEIFSAYEGCKLAAQYVTGTGSASQDLSFSGDGKTWETGDWKGWTFCKDLTKTGGVQFLLASKWANVVCRFTSATKIATMYINGEKMKEQDYNLYDPPLTLASGLIYNGAPGNNTFVFGFIQDKNNPTISDGWAQYEITTNNHFKGLLDNVRIFHKSLTETEIRMMYDSEKP